jgi:hypothetical protein
VPVSEQDRLKALKEHDTEAYYNLLKEHKNVKILNVLTETDKYLKALGLAVCNLLAIMLPHLSFSLPLLQFFSLLGYVLTKFTPWRCCLIPVRVWIRRRYTGHNILSMVFF